MHANYVFIPTIFFFALAVLIVITYPLFKSEQTGMGKFLLKFCPSFGLAFIGLLILANCPLSPYQGLSIVSCLEDTPSFGKIRTIKPHHFYRLMPGEKIVPHDFTKQVNLTVHPVTENPKVRNLNISLTVSIAPKIQDAMKLDKYLKGEDIPGSGNIEKFLQFHLYEFTEMNSKELGKLYNPLDQKQQTVLFDLISLYYKEKLSDLPIKPIRASFEIL